MEVLDPLRNIPLFAGLDDERLVELSGTIIRRKFPRHTILFSKGDESDALYLVVNGSAKAVINDENGREMVLNQFGPGEFFGEFALLDGQPRSATVITREPTEAMIIRRDDFQRLVLCERDVVLDLLKILLVKLRLATEKIESLTFLNVYGRITQLLLNLASPCDGFQVITERLTHQEIANMVGASREMVSKIMKQLEIGGYIVNENKYLIINKKFPKEF
jgi:CRP/FNR family cyclic AMP-dependent transcriptional regulator